jgi:hypothetical protein
MVFATTPAPDHWLNIVLGVAALLTIAGVLIGAFFTVRYGRRASVSLSAEALRTEVGFVIVARPSVKAVGVYRVKFVEGPAGSTAGVTEMYPDASGRLHEGMTYPVHDLFGDSFVDGGEELVTTTLVSVPSPAGSVIGWTVWVRFRAPNRILNLHRTRWIVRHGPVNWLIQNGPTGWLIHNGPAHWLIRSRPLRWARRRVVSGWSWADQVFISVPDRTASPSDGASRLSSDA